MWGRVCSPGIFADGGQHQCNEPSVRWAPKVAGTKRQEWHSCVPPAARDSCLLCSDLEPASRVMRCSYAALSRLTSHPVKNPLLTASSATARMIAHAGSRLWGGPCCLARTLAYIFRVNNYEHAIMRSYTRPPRCTAARTARRETPQPSIPAGLAQPPEPRTRKVSCERSRCAPGRARCSLRSPARRETALVAPSPAIGWSLAMIVQRDERTL